MRAGDECDGTLVAHASQWANVIVREGKLGYVNLRDARLDTVRREGCILGELDPARAVVTRLVINGCQVVFHYRSYGVGRCDDQQRATARPCAVTGSAFRHYHRIKSSNPAITRTLRFNPSRFQMIMSGLSL